VNEDADRALTDAAAAAIAGELVVLPTDTVYGIGTRPDDPVATERLFAAKRRPRDLELPILIASLEAARTVAAFDRRAERVARRAWPGAVTLVLPRAAGCAGWSLGGDDRTIGVRIPRHPLALALLDRTGPLAVTSANLSGEPTPPTCAGVEEIFGPAVAVYLCEPAELSGDPSTVVDLAHGDPHVLRPGALDEEALRALIG